MSKIAMFGRECKMRKIFGPKVVHFPVRTQINTKFANFLRIYIPRFITFRNQTLQFLQYFLAVVMDFVLLA